MTPPNPDFWVADSAAQNQAVANDRFEKGANAAFTLTASAPQIAQPSHRK
jgi:hypothetical protein